MPWARKTLTHRESARRWWWCHEHGLTVRWSRWRWGSWGTWQVEFQLAAVVGQRLMSHSEPFIRLSECGASSYRFALSGGWGPNTQKLDSVVIGQNAQCGRSDQSRHWAYVIRFFALCCVRSVIRCSSCQRIYSRMRTAHTGDTQFMNITNLLYFLNLLREYFESPPPPPLVTGTLSRFAINKLTDDLSSSMYVLSISLTTNRGQARRFCNHKHRRTVSVGRYRLHININLK